jgi:hypothetical protein
MSTAISINLTLAGLAVATIVALIARSIATQELERRLVPVRPRSLRLRSEPVWRQIGAGRVQVWPAV